MTSLLPPPSRSAALGALLLLAGVLAAAEDAEASFIEDMLAARQQHVALRAARTGANGFKAWQSGNLTGKSAPVAIDLDVSTVETLHLMVKAPQGNGGAHAVWGEPVLIDANGAETRLGKLPLIRPRVGWATLAKDAFEGRPLRFGERSLAHGIYAHAESSFSVNLGRKYARFRAVVGINATGSPDAMVVFQVDSVLRTEWERDLSNEHRELYARYRSDTGNDWARWFDGQDTKADKALVEAMIKRLGRGDAAARAALAQLDQAQAPWSDPRWLQLYLRCSRSADQVAAFSDDAEGVAKAAVLIKRVKPDLDFAASVARAQTLADSVDLADAAAVAKAREELTQMRRAILFTHPALAFDRLLVNVCCPPQYSHNVDQYLGRHSKTAPGLVVLKDWKSGSPELSWLTRDRLPPGAIRHPDLSYDATTLLFAYCDHRIENHDQRRFLVYEMPVDGSAPPRQVTGGAGDPMVREAGRYTVLLEDFDPTYLPDGGFVFTSTRSQSFGRCHGGRYTPSFYLYRGQLDGSGIRMLSYGEANEITPSVLNDGRIVYNRWDYINRHDCQFHKLWVTNPDGTATANFWGNLTNNPLSVSEPRAIPGTHKIMCTAGAHHSFTAGTTLLIDTAKGDEGETPLTHLTPEVRYAESQGWPSSTYATPYPLTEDLFFAAYSATPHIGQGQIQKDDAYSIQLVFHVDGKAYREPIFTVAGFSCWAPTPLIARQRPPVLPSRLDPKAEPWGTFFVQNVYESTQPIEKGVVKWLRVNEIINQPAASHAQRSAANNEITKRALGTVPVEADGSVAFRAPAGKRLQLQILDAERMSVLTMRTFIYLQPGEVQGCTGCHESRQNAPSSLYAKRTAAAATLVRDIVPTPGPAVSCGFSYVAQVQPVLDRHCISCHGLDGKLEAKVNLLGSYRPEHDRFSESYVAMVDRPGFVKLLQRNAEPPFSTPREAYAFRSRLPALLRNHQGVKLEADEWERVITWLDLNCQFYGDYSFNRPENRIPSPEGEKNLRAAIAKRFGDQLAAQPFAALVNNMVASESRILKAPLAARAGGWGQLKGGWDSTQDSSYQEMAKLVEASLAPLPYQDREGTCNRGEGKCVCGCCWVKPAELKYRQLIGWRPTPGPAVAATK